MSKKSTLPSLFLAIIVVALIDGPSTGEGINVGTTLFTKADCQRECWSEEGIALLTSRMILEDLLPSPAVLVMDSNEFVNDLVEYFRLILDVIRTEAAGKSKRITLIALTDLLGGYMNHAVLPMARYAYYAGIIDYDSMENLLQLFDELKFFLRTNGRGWAKPMKQAGDNFAIERIVLKKSSKDREDACNGLVLRENETTEFGSCGVSLPMPFMDSNNKPVAIAMPYKSCSLYNVAANTSAYIVMKFFIKAYECLVNKHAPPVSMDNFISELCVWIEKKVEPRLHDEAFYAAFGGVLRVRNTLRRMGVKQGRIEMESDNDLRDVSGAATGDLAGRSIPSNIFENKKMTKMNMVLLALITTICLWFLLGSTFICYKIRASRQKKSCDNSCAEDSSSEYGSQSRNSGNSGSSSRRSTDPTTDGSSSGRGRPPRDDERPSRDDGRPSKDDGRPSRDEGRPSKDEKKPSRDEGRRSDSPAKITPSQQEETGPDSTRYYSRDEGQDPDGTLYRSAGDDPRNNSLYKSTTGDDDNKSRQSRQSKQSRKSKLVQEKSLFHDTEPHQRLRHTMIREEKRRRSSSQSSNLGSQNRTQSNLLLEGDTTEDDNDKSGVSFGRPDGKGGPATSTPKANRRRKF